MEGENGRITIRVLARRVEEGVDQSKGGSPRRGRMRRFILSNDLSFSWSLRPKALATAGKVTSSWLESRQRGRWGGIGRGASRST